MKHEYWMEHLQQWQIFLDERAIQVSNAGEKTKIGRQRNILEEI